MWPMMVTLLNLPPHIQNMPGSIMLAGIILGRHEPKNTDPYIIVLVCDDSLTGSTGIDIDTVLVYELASH